MSEREPVELEHDPVLGPYDPNTDGAPDFHVPEFIDVPPFQPTENFKGKANPLPRTWEEGKRLGWSDESLDRLLKEGLIKPPNPMLQDVSAATMSDKLEITFRFLDRHGSPEMTQQLRDLFSPENMAITTGAISVWAAGHFFGVSEVVDLILLMVGAMTLGPQVLELTDLLYKYFELVENARNVRDLDNASKILAKVVTTLGITTFLALIGRAGKGPASAAKNRVAWKLQDLGRKHLPGRWPKRLPNSDLLPIDILYGTPRSPVPLITPQTRGVGGLRAMASAARKAGMTVAELEYTMAVAARYGVHIYVRPAGAGTAPLRASGAVSKREWMKMNTVNGDDIAMGAPAHSRDHVAHFKPKAWKDIEAKIPAADRARVKERWEKRMKSYQDYDGDVQQNISRGKIRLGEGGVLYDAQTGRPYTGDVDFFEYRGPDGRTLKPGDPLFTSVQNALERGPTFAQHQTHFTWKPHGPTDEKIFWDIVVRHGANEPLLWVQPSGNVSLVYADVPMCLK
jgi:hypothetical protein